jgi:hypothetical protein
MFHVLKDRTLAVGAALAIVAALVLGACNAASSPGSGAGGGNPTIEVTSPADGAQVSIPFSVTVQSNGPIGPPESGNHHAHLYFDTGIDSSSYDLVYSNTVQVTRQLSPGKHTIIAALANPDHSLVGPTKMFTVNVTGGGSGAGPSAGSSVGASPSAAAPGYSYGTR